MHGVASMSAMSGMPAHHDMASMSWLPLDGAGWAAAGTSFLAMWVAMTAAMMLPSVAPALWRYRRSAGASGPALLAGAGYFAVWTAVGAAVFPLGVALAAARLPLRGLALASGAIVVLAGALQFTAWKARRLARCRNAGPRHGAHAGAGTALRHGVRLGCDCVLSCAGPMASLLAIGMMDLRAMAVVTAAVTAERLAPAGERVARAVGLLGVAIGVLLIARA